MMSEDETLPRKLSPDIRRHRSWLARGLDGDPYPMRAALFDYFLTQFDVDRLEGSIHNLVDNTVARAPHERIKVPDDDHHTVFSKGRTTVVYVSQPYHSQTHSQYIAAVESFARRWGLTAHIFGNGASWYNPGSSILTALTRNVNGVSLISRFEDSDTRYKAPFVEFESVDGVNRWSIGPDGLKHTKLNRLRLAESRRREDVKGRSWSTTSTPR